MTTAPGPPADLAAAVRDVVGATLVQHFHRQVATRGDRAAMHFRSGDRWAPITWGQVGAAARRVMAFLVDDGVEAGDQVAIWSGHRPEWHIADAAILAVRARSVPVPPSLDAAGGEHVLGHSEAVVAIVESRAILDRVLEVRDRLPRLRRIVLIETEGRSDPGGLVVGWDAALARGQDRRSTLGMAIDARIRASSPGDVATLVYTPGPGGAAQGVVLTHANLTAGVAAALDRAGAGADDRVLSHRAPSEILERMVTEFHSWVFGNPTFFLGAAERLAERLVEVRPTMLVSVPEVWEALAARIRQSDGGRVGGGGRLARRALAAGEAAAVAAAGARDPSGFLALRARLADRAVLARLRTSLGLDGARLLASDGGPLEPAVGRLFAALGLRIGEIYGQPETAGMTAMTLSGAGREGSVGTPFWNIDVRIAADGEVLVRGPAVFGGYHRDAEATAAALRDGWLHTGDIGELGSDHHLRVHLRVNRRHRTATRA